MPVTVADILQLPILAQAQVLAGWPGLHNSVRWVHVADVRDIARLLQGGELVLSTGLPLAGSADQQRSFVQELSAVGAAGLVLELVRQFQEVPAVMLDAANAAGFPIIVLPYEVPFVRVTEAAHTLIVNRQYAQIRKAETVATTLNGIALRQEGVAAILAALSGALENPVLFVPLDPLQPTIMHPPGALQAEQVETLRPQLTDQVTERTYALGERRVRTSCVPVVLGQQPAGHLLVPHRNRPLTELDRLVIDRAATTVAFEFLRQQSMRQQWQMSTGELLDDILTGTFRDPRELQFRARELAIHLEDSLYAVITVQVLNAEERSRLEQRLRTATAGRNSRYLLSARGDRVRVLVAAGQLQGLRERVDRLLAAIACPAGAGRPFGDLSEAPRALEQAEYTLMLRLRHPDAGFGPLFDSTGTYRLLLAAMRSDELAWFVDDELGPLVRAARSDSAELLHTLRLLLDVGLNVAEAARRLHLTRQALYYRKERIEELLGCSLEDPEKRLSFSLALRALELTQLQEEASSPSRPGAVATLDSHKRMARP